MKTLTAAQVKSIKEAGLHRAGVGLYLAEKPPHQRSMVVGMSAVSFVPSHQGHLFDPINPSRSLYPIIATPLAPAGLPDLHSPSDLRRHPILRAPAGLPVPDHLLHPAGLLDP